MPHKLRVNIPSSYRVSNRRVAFRFIAVLQGNWQNELCGEEARMALKSDGKLEKETRRSQLDAV
jgi:hypothetical protein